MNELAELMASRHWPFIWPCYALAVAMFAALAVRAVLHLRRWERAAREASEHPTPVAPIAAAGDAR